MMNPELNRLLEHHRRLANWRHWGPYLSERSWGTVREDYSVNGDAWNYFPHDHARSRSYRWNEDGIGGISDRFQYLCFAPAFWNGKDPILKERLFGLNPYEGNHSEDVKEYSFYLDSTPTHSYMEMLYKYPQLPFPYQILIEENQNRSSDQPEFELWETGIFNEQRYFDISITYAKADPDDILILITADNRGPDKAILHLLPTLWFRNTWGWGYDKGPMEDVPTKPVLFLTKDNHIQTTHDALGTYYLYSKEEGEWIFTNNETNHLKIHGTQNESPYVKDAFHSYLIENLKDSINPRQEGTKGAIHLTRILEPQEKWTAALRLTAKKLSNPFESFENIVSQRKKEADLFYESKRNPTLSDDQKKIQRGAFANLLWGKQLYYYDMEQWIDGDDKSLKRERNQGWLHLVNFDVISMPDKWEYPWYASWDLCFHCIPLSMIDPDFAKRQLLLITREWYMHPNGQIPAYEWNFGDVNPPVTAWSAWRVYKIDGKETGKPDRNFLEGIFHKLLLNFTWWVNRKDQLGHNVFQGGFLGLDNISIFDRSIELEKGTRIDQADGTAWMGMNCLLMMKIAIELARTEPVYQDCATKFFEHFLRISSAMIKPERKGYSLWNSEDGFFYDALDVNGKLTPLKIRSLVGLVPLLAVETIDQFVLEAMPVFHDRMRWFLSQRHDYAITMTCTLDTSKKSKVLLSMLTKEHLISTLRYMLDEDEFLSPFGIRSLSKFHEKNPFILNLNGEQRCIGYQPGESSYRVIAGGNSNWRGPVWFPINFLIIEALQKYHYYYGESLKVEFPTRSGNWISLGEVATQLSLRLNSLFEKNKEGFRPIFGKDSPFEEKNWSDLLLFFEYFHGENGKGLGASHQGWTSLVAKLLQQCGGN